MESYASSTSHPPVCRIHTLNTEIAHDRSLAANNLSVVSGSSGWSRAIAERYHLRLSDELAHWFDSGVCDGIGHGEFCEPAHPEQLIENAPDCIWPGLMPPDVLPLVSNGLGDWLCGRVSANGTISEVIYWYHGGGDYLPYGKGLAEAIIFDTLASRLPGRRQLHAVPAEREEPEHQAIISSALVEWALTQLSSEVANVMSIDAPPSLVASELSRHRIATDAVRCDAVLAALDSAMRTRLTTADAAALGVSWDKVVAKWMFDTSTIPGAHRSQVAARLVGANADSGHADVDHEGLFAQDWDTVERICGEIARERSDLGWVHDCLGWAAQRRGDISTAATHYEQSAVTSVFTDQSIRFKTHFDGDRVAKFSVARLLELGQAHRLDAEYVNALTHADRPNWREQVVSYWLGQLSATLPTADQRYQLIYRAGWDVGCESMHRYHEILTMLADAATDAKQLARAEVARTHAACIEDRYLRRARS